MYIPKQRIYRVSEGFDGQGMYKGSGWLVSGAMHGPRHPCPEVDARMGKDWDDLYGTYGQSYRARFLFGFATLDQLRSWIYQAQWRQGLHDLGLRIHVWERNDTPVSRVPNKHQGRPDGVPPSFLIGDTQAVFDPAYFNHVETMELINLP